jgi:hypothetical protein
MVGTGREGWRTDTMGLGGGLQGSNLFPEAGGLTSSRKVSLDNYCDYGCERLSTILSATESD